MLESLDEITYLTDPAEKQLNPRQQVASNNTAAVTRNGCTIRERTRRQQTVTP